MSIENDLSKIATSLEEMSEILGKIADHITNPPIQTVNVSAPVVEVAAAAAEVFAGPTPPSAKKPGRPAGAKSAPAPVQEVAPAEQAIAVTMDDVMDLMRELVRKLGPEKGPLAGKEMLAKYGADKIRTLDAKNYATIFAELQKALK